MSDTVNLVPVHRSWLFDLRNVLDGVDAQIERDEERGMTRTAVCGYLDELLANEGYADELGEDMIGS